MDISYRAKLSFAFILTAVACATPEPPPPLDLRPQDQPEREQMMTSSQTALQNLDRFAPKDSYKYGITKDIRSLLEAEIASDSPEQFALMNGSYAESIRQTPSDRFASAVWNRWIRKIHKTYKIPPSKLELAQKLLELARAEKLESFLKKNSFSDDASLVLFLQKNFTDLAFTLDPLKIEEAKPNNVAAESKVSTPNSLQKISQLSKKLCNQKRSAEDIAKIAKPLSPLRQKLFQASIWGCEGKNHDAIKLFEELSRAEPSSDRQVVAIQFVALRELTKLYKAQSQRGDVAKSYARLVQLKPDLRYLSKELDRDVAAIKISLVDDLLWACRNSALTGNYEQAETQCKTASTTIDSIYASERLSANQKDVLKGFQAEAFQALATRIAVERGDYPQAINYLKAGMEIPNLQVVWRERFAWLVGLYHFISGQYASSLTYWEPLFKKLSDESDEPKMRFWLARTYLSLNKTSDANEQLLALHEKYPLSYYSVIAPSVAGVDEVANWKGYFSNLHGKNLNLVDHERFDLDDLRSDEATSVSLLRAEIAIASEIPTELIQPLVRDLSLTLGKQRKRVSKDQYALGQVYLSRLMFASGLYAQSFSLTNDLSKADKEFWQKWPDQLYVLFPQPYSGVIKESAAAAGIDEELIYAIARQESSFNATIESPAAAIGLLQLIPPTAERFAKVVGLKYTSITQSLKQPEFNVRLGAEYLKFLNKYYKANEAAVYGSYNAGEFAVDSWIERRKNPDPLLWVELIPFGETQGYVRNVWRNRTIYKFMNELKANLAFEFGLDDHTTTIQ